MSQGGVCNISIAHMAENCWLAMARYAVADPPKIRAIEASRAPADQPR
jgi:hypothetical protein